MAEPLVRIGYMNAHHQRVIARARVRENPALFCVLRCAICGHSYCVENAHVVGYRCPNHDGGAPAISAESRDVAWGG
jgi:hypothetical protein